MPSSAEISARLNGDNSNFRSMLNQAELATSQAGKRLTKNLDLRDASRTMAAAIGLNIQDIAEKFARLWTGVSKDAEDAFKKLEDLSDKATQLTRKRIEDSQTTEQKIQDAQRQSNSLLVERAAIFDKLRAQQNKYDEEHAASVKRNAETQGNLFAAQIGQQRTALLTDKERVRIDEIKVELMQKQEEIQKQGIKLIDEFSEKQKKSDQEHKEQIQYALEVKEKALKYAQENRELLTLEARGINKLTDEERVRLKVLQLQSKEKMNQGEIDRILAKLPEQRTNADKLKLESLMKENKQIELQIEGFKTLNAEADKLAANVGAVEEATGFATNKLKSYIDEWTDFAVTIQSFGRGDKELSDRELERKIANLKADIAKREAALSMAGSMAGSSAYDPLLDPQKSNLQQTLNEIDLRRDVRRSAGFFGEEAAFNMFPGITESRFREILGNNTEQMKQTELLQQIVDQQKQGIVTVPIGT